MKEFLFWDFLLSISKSITFAQIRFEEFLLKGCLFLGRWNLGNIKLKYCSLFFGNGHVTDIKTLMFWLTDLIVCVQILFGLILQKDFSLFIG